MAKSFRLQVFTQEQQVLDEQVTSIMAPGEDGYFGVLADHAPLISVLGPGKLTIMDTQKVYNITGGFLEVVDNTATVLADAIQ